jgi:hypothetical protein
VGEFYPAFIAFIKLAAKVILQRLETLGNRRWTYVHPARRLCQALVLGNIYKEFDTIKEHGLFALLWQENSHPLSKQQILRHSFLKNVLSYNPGTEQLGTLSKHDNATADYCLESLPSG